MIKSKRIMDIILIVVTLILTVPLVLIISMLIFLFDGKGIFHVSKRVGRKNKIFKMYKFRTMKINSPQIATHLMKNPSNYTTYLGSILRKLSLDELPQLYNVLIGEMTIVGPRPALFNQKDLIKLRTLKGVSNLVPGITGWAQINGRDNLSIKKKVELDFYYKKNRSMLLDFSIIFITFTKIFSTKGVTH